jgi:hypothetical protein
MSPSYGEQDVEVRLFVRDLLWRPVGHVVRFVLVEHPVRGRLSLKTTHLGPDASEGVRLYSYRFKIEVSLKEVIHTVGACSYHCWMKAMRPIYRASGEQYLHREPEATAVTAPATGGGAIVTSGGIGGVLETWGRADRAVPDFDERRPDSSLDSLSSKTNARKVMEEGEA